MKKVHPVKVRWVDSAGAGPWMPDAEVRFIKPSRITSVGFLLEQDQKRIVLAQSIPDDGGEVGNVLTIPMACVKSIRPVKMP